MPTRTDPNRPRTKETQTSISISRGIRDRFIDTIYNKKQIFQDCDSWDDVFEIIIRWLNK